MRTTDTETALQASVGVKAEQGCSADEHLNDVDQNGGTKQVAGVSNKKTPPIAVMQKYFFK